jgi:hypothetical protein
MSVTTRYRPISRSLALGSVDTEQAAREHADGA